MWVADLPIMHHMLTNSTLQRILYLVKLPSHMHWELRSSCRWTPTRYLYICAPSVRIPTRLRSQIVCLLWGNTAVALGQPRLLADGLGGLIGNDIGAANWSNTSVEHL